MDRTVLLLPGGSRRHVELTCSTSRHTTALLTDTSQKETLEVGHTVTTNITYRSLHLSRRHIETLLSEEDINNSQPVGLNRVLT